jgi:hypothetical protein
LVIGKTCFHLAVSIVAQSGDTSWFSEVPVLNASSPLFRRLWAYLQERFPPVVYTVLVALFFCSAFLVARAWDTSVEMPAMAPVGAVVLWLAFLHLRLMDEAKDYVQDCQTHPDRVLSRGIVSLSLLGRFLVVVILAEAILSAMLGSVAFYWWLGVIAYSLAMRFEFGVGAWLSRRIVLYAITHNPVVALLALFIFGTTGAQWDDRFVFYVLMVSLGSLAFEVGRKTRLPDEENAGVETYSSALGRGVAGWFLRAVVVLGGAMGVCTVIAVGADGTQFWFAIALLGFGVAVTLLGAGVQAPAKRVEAVSSLFLLLSFLGVGVAAW